MLRIGSAIGERESLNGKDEGNVNCQYSDCLEFQYFDVRFQNLQSSQLDRQALINRDWQ
jgi:hypothetical protein